MSGDDPKRARHRQRQAAYEARPRDGIGLSRRYPGGILYAGGTQV